MRAHRLPNPKQRALIIRAAAMRVPRSGGALLLAAALLEPSGAFLQPRAWPGSSTPHHSSSTRQQQQQQQRAAPLHTSFWKGIQDLFNPAGTSSNAGGPQQGPGLTAAEEAAKKRRHFRAFEPQDKAPVGPYVLGGEAAGLPSMDDLWREAWPTEACKDIMARREAANEGVGAPQPDALVRSFGTNDTILTVLYKDSSSWCPYSASVWMALEELRLPYKIKRVNLLAYGEKPEWVYRVSSTGLLPVLEVDGRILRESVDICQFANYFANSRYPQLARPMYPDKEDPLHDVAERLLGLERDLFRDFFIYVFEGPEPKGREAFLGTLGEVEAALGAYPDGPWFLPGAGPSVVDCVFAPKVERVVAACLYWKGLDLRDRAQYPNLVRWFDALDARPSFAFTKSDFYSLVTAMEPLFGRAYAVHTPEAQALRARIDGVAPNSWRLPISPDEAALEPPPPGAGAFPSDEYARQAAAVRLIINHKRLPAYMLRALGTPGPEYRSVLADPLNEGGDERFAPAIDAAYRYLVLALLRGPAAVQPLLRADRAGADAAYQAKEGAGKDPAAARARVVACLEYLRERISVPRDMTLAEARQLRAHLNWLADELR